MRIAVVDTSPLINLTHLDLAPELALFFDRVHVPRAVQEELNKKGIQVQGVWVDPDQSDPYDDLRPLPGDLYGVCNVGDPNKYPQHVGVIVDPRDDAWITADAGQGNQDEQLCCYCKREFDWVKSILKQVYPVRETGNREVAGWIDIELLMSA